MTSSRYAIVLLPGAILAAQSYETSAYLATQFPTYSTLKDSVSYAHLSLFMAQFADDMLSQVQDRLLGIASCRPVQYLQTSSL